MILKIMKGLLLSFFLILLFCLPEVINAQINFWTSTDLSNIKVENISNSELQDVLDKATREGYSKNEIIRLAAERGLPPAEIRILENRLSGLNTTGLHKDKMTDSVRQESIDDRYNKYEVQTPMHKVKIDDSIFGSELFSSGSTVFEPNLRIPAPANYMLGPDDEVIISVFGLSEKRYALAISETGEIYIPNVGPILLAGLTLEQAEEKIKNILSSTIYTAIKTGQTKVQLTLGKIKSIRVTVIGEAKKPGTYTVSSLTTLYNLLYLCGGPTKMGSYREIELIRGKEKRTSDLYDFLVYGDLKGNYLLKEGDVIRIPYYENRVTLIGNVKREGKFEMTDGETFQNLLKFSGGFNDLAYRGLVTITRITDSTRRIIDLASKDFADFKIMSGDQITVSQLHEEYGNRVYITGAIHRSGPYEFVENMTVDQLINKAGGILPDAYWNRALIYRYLPNKTPTMQSVNLDSILNVGQKFYLQKNDSVVINALSYYRSPNTITVLGEVRNPKDIKWRQNITLKDVLTATGGIKESGDSSNIEISRRISDINLTEVNHEESHVITINLFDAVDSDIILKPDDIILIKEKPGFSNQRTVLIQGEVISPGRYSLNRSRTRISDILIKTGGFRASADSSSLTIRRISKSDLTAEERSEMFHRILNISEDSLQNNPILRNELYKTYDLITIDLGKALSQPNSSANLSLEDGDILTINRSSNLVKISGAVYFPTIVSYKPGKNLNYYVKQAGNFMQDARKTGALVIQPDGQVKTVSHFLFFKFYPKIKPRAEIFVPSKDKSNKTKVGPAEWAVIISALGIVSNVILNITK